MLGKVDRFVLQRQRINVCISRVELLRVELFFCNLRQSFELKLLFVVACKFVDCGSKHVLSCSRLPFSLCGRPHRRVCGFSCDLVVTASQQATIRRGEMELPAMLEQVMLFVMWNK